jgi:hypothetical protein
LRPLSRRRWQEYYDHYLLWEAISRKELFQSYGVADLLRRNRVDLKTAQDLMRHANPGILMKHYQQTVTEERRAAQTLAFDSIWVDNTHSSKMSSDRTHGNPRRPQKEEVMPLIN